MKPRELELAQQFAYYRNGFDVLNNGPFKR